MGFSPAQVKEMTLWEFQCAFVAWAKFHGVLGRAEQAVTLERLQELGIE